MFRTNESLEALCSIAKDRKFNLRRLADGINGANEGRVKQLAMRYINTLLSEAKKAFYVTPHIVAAPELPVITKSYVFERDKKQGVQVVDRSNRDTFTTIDAIASVGHPRLLTAVEARIGSRECYVSEYFAKIQRKIRAMMELSPQGFGWLLFLPSNYERLPIPSPFLNEFKRMKGKAVILPHSTAEFRGAVAYHQVG